MSKIYEKKVLIEPRAGQLVFTVNDGNEDLGTLLYHRKSDDVCHVEVNSKIISLPRSKCFLAIPRLNRQLWIRKSVIGTYQVSEEQEPGAVLYEASVADKDFV